MTKQELKVVIKKYMKANNLGYVSLEASMSMSGDKVIMNINEEEDDVNDKFRWN